MGKRVNTVPSVQITISVTPHVQAYLEQLVLTGLYGKNRAEAAERLVSDGLKPLIQDGTLKRLKQADESADGT